MMVRRSVDELKLLSPRILVSTAFFGTDNSATPVTENKIIASRRSIVHRQDFLVYLCSGTSHPPSSRSKKAPQRIDRPVAVSALSGQLLMLTQSVIKVWK
jgi:hypothetical protein